MSTNQFRGTSWIVDLLQGWVGEHEEDCSLIFHPEGVGALQISSYLKDDTVTDDDLRGLAQEHLVGGAKLDIIETKGFTGFTLAFGADGKFWQQWYLAKGRTALFVTYNCEESECGAELGEVREMVLTLAAT